MKFPFLLLILLVLGCAVPKYESPEFSVAMTMAEQEKLQTDAIEFQLKRRGRLYDLAWPLLTSNTDLCPNTRKSIGVVLADLDAYADFVGGLNADQLEKLDIEDDMHIIHVSHGSPADIAGLIRGDFIRSVNGEDYADQKPTRIAKAISQAVEEDQPVRLRIRRNDADLEVELNAVEACDVAIKLSSSSSLNAMAMDQTIVFNAGLMRVASDEIVQHVLAHELAHVALRHPRKVGRNIVVSGGFLYVPIMYSAGALADRTLKLLRIKRKGSLALRGVSTGVPYSKDFEAEADYVGLYMLARASGDLDAATDVFRIFAKESPSTTWLRYTHPMTPERIIAAELTVAEIKAKQAEEKELLPELKK